MKEFERKQTLERINREGATVGASIPDRIAVQGEEVALQEFVFEVKRRDTVPPGERERVEQAKKNLRRERHPSTAPAFGAGLLRPVYGVHFGGRRLHYGVRYHAT